ncbi:hypothetical protein HHK36_030884 [Tetracentron sinense]|uniref:Methyltransferase FkbM domain-containing protein n=1 Tax=Tetracentron sinense TaxID=13715 RepID=A0A835D1Y8_TETSI|nr:hypothetical protein HHK36_030884 [Tetracentron sinense]
MAYAWKRDRPSRILSSRNLLFFFSISLLLIFFFFFLSPSSNPNPNFTQQSSLKTLTLTPFRSIQSFDCFKCPQSYPVIANVVEGVRYPFFYSLADLGTLPDKPHKNIVRMLKGKPFRKPDISVTIQEVLEKMRADGTDGFVVDVGANVGMATFAAAVMGFRVLSFEPVFENLQRICDGVFFNRVGDRVTLFEAAASDRLGNITFHKSRVAHKEIRYMFLNWPESVFSARGNVPWRMLLHVILWGTGVYVEKGIEGNQKSFDLVSKRGVHQVNVLDMAVFAASQIMEDKQLVGRLDNSAVSATGAKMAFKTNEEIELQVRSIPLDEVISESDRVLLLKIDVQGWEYHVLRGASKLLSRKGGEAPYLIYEEDERLLKASNSSAKEIREFLSSMGYQHCTQHGTDAHCTKN